VKRARSEYKQTEQNREQIKQYFSVTLLLIMVLSILFSIFAAFLYSQKLTEPIRTLLAGTVAVASGNLYKKFQSILPLSLTQTPLGNVLIAANNNFFYEVENNSIKAKIANIFTFFTHWTLPPIKAAPYIFKKKAIKQKHLKHTSFYLID
jgi:methyl-accepting chemotaxis protein